jgi:F plasmid transfer operon protein TraF
MQNLFLGLLVLFVVMTGAAQGAEFQPMGALGIGGAGVARTFDAYAPYWNPAGLAFNQTSFSSRLNAGAGLRINSSMAENIDRLGKLDVDNLGDLNITVGTTLTPAQIDQNRVLVNKAVQFVGVLGDLNQHSGTLTANADAVLGFQYKHFAVGGFTTMELASFSNSETTNVRIGGTSSTDANTALTDFATGIGAAQNAARSASFFTTQQYDAIKAAFGNDQRAAEITNTLEAQLATSNATKLTPEQARDALLQMGQAFQNNQGSLENNRSTLEYLGIILIDIPISYGHQFDLGSFGKLGIGGSLKVIQARTFIGESQIVQVKDSGDIVKNITDHHQDSTGFGIDLGALWKYGDWLGVGIVAKNLNSPEFDTPEVTLPIRGKVKETIRVKPQVRAGVALDPFSWLTIAADLDLTENDTVLVGKTSRNLGGGLELHPYTWFKFRLGAYKNLANSDVGVVGTTGLTIGSKWVNLDLDAAASPETGKYKEHNYPKEGRVQASLNVQF